MFALHNTRSNCEKVARHVATQGTRHRVDGELIARSDARQGDLVQLKELPVQGTFELKNKAMDVLVTVKAHTIFIP